MLVILGICRQNYLMQITASADMDHPPQIHAALDSNFVELFVQEFQEKNRTDKALCVAANLITVARPFAHLANNTIARAWRDNHPSPLIRHSVALGRAGIAIFDRIDGDLARLTRQVDSNGSVVRSGGVTRLGEVIDPAADKITGVINGLDGVRNERLHPGLFAVRSITAATKTRARNRTGRITKGEVSVAAKPHAKWAEGALVAADITAALSSKPSKLNTAVQFGAVVAGLVSSYFTIRDLDRATDAWQAKPNNLQQPPSLVP